MLSTFVQRRTAAVLAIVALTIAAVPMACGTIGSTLGGDNAGGDSGAKKDVEMMTIDGGANVDATTIDADTSDVAAPSIDSSTPIDSSMVTDASADSASALSREEVLDPDWMMPESMVVQTAIPTTGKYYVATNGSDNAGGKIDAPFATFQKAIDLAQPGDVILVRAGTYTNQRAVFMDANSGTSDNFITFAADPNDPQGSVIIDGAGIMLDPSVVAGLVEVDGSYIRINGLTVQNVAGAYAEMGIVAQNKGHVVIDHNSTNNTASSGIGAWYAQSVIIRDNFVHNADVSGNQESISLNDVTTFEVSFNTVWGTTPWPWKTMPIGIDPKNGSSSGRVVGNTVHDIAYDGIYVDAYEAATHDIDVYANVVYACQEGIVLISELTGALSNVRVFDNVVYDTFNTGIGFPAWGGASTNAGSISNIEIFNNTIDNTFDSLDGGGGEFVNPRGFYFGYPSMSDITARNNIIATQGPAFVFAETVTNLIVDHNLVQAPTLSSGNVSANTPFSESDLIEANPDFVNGGAGNCRLTSSSPAIGSGNDNPTDGGLTFNYDGVTRPPGSAIDIGAF